MDRESEFGDLAPQAGQAQQSSPRRDFCVHNPEQSLDRCTNMRGLWIGSDERAGIRPDQPAAHSGVFGAKGGRTPRAPDTQDVHCDSEHRMDDVAGHRRHKPHETLNISAPVDLPRARNDRADHPCDPTMPERVVDGFRGAENAPLGAAGAVRTRGRHMREREAAGKAGRQRHQDTR